MIKDKNGREITEGSEIKIDDNVYRVETFRGALGYWVGSKKIPRNFQTLFNDIFLKWDSDNEKILNVEEIYPEYDEEYLKKCAKRATPAWEKIGDVTQWVRDLRGGY